MATLKKREQDCRRALSGGRYMYGACWDLLDDVVKVSGAHGKQKVLMYDIRQYAKTSAVFPPHHDRVEKYLNNKAVRAALHASQCPLVFKECTDPPYNALKHQDGLGVTREIAFLLERNVRMIFFNGGFFFLAASLQNMKKKTDRPRSKFHPFSSHSTIPARLAGLTSSIRPFMHSFMN